MMDCPGSDKLAAYVDGRVDVTEEVLILEHCAECDDCRRELALGFQVRKTSAGEMPAALKTRVLRAMDRERLPRARRSLRRDRSPGYGHVAAAAALLLAAGILMLLRLKPWEPPVPNQTAEKPQPAPAPRVVNVKPPAPPAPKPVPAKPEEKPKPELVKVVPARPQPKPFVPRPVLVPEVKQPEPVPGQPIPVKPIPGETQAEKPEAPSHQIAERSFSDLEVTDFTGSLSVRRKGTRRPEKLVGVARLSEGDVVTAKTASSFHVMGRHPVVLSAQASVSMAYVEEEQAPYLRLHAGEAMVDSTGLTRWIVSDGTVSLIVKQARARFAAIPRQARLAVMALSEPLYVQPDGGRVYPVAPGQELQVSKDSAEIRPLKPDEARLKAALFDSARPREKTIFYTSCDPTDAKRDHFYVEEGSYFNKQALLSRLRPDRSAHAEIRPNPRFNWARGLVFRCRVRTNSQRIRIVMPVAGREMIFAKTVQLKRSELNRWKEIEIAFQQFQWIDEDGGTASISSTEKFEAIQFEVSQQDVFGDQRGAFLVDDIQIVNRN